MFSTHSMKYIWYLPIKSKFSFYFIQYTGIFLFTKQAVKMQKPKIFENTNNFGTTLFLTFPKKLKILNMNFQSVVNKVHCLLDIENPDAVVGTESWLHPDIADSEVFPRGYSVFRADRNSKTKTCGGGVFILVRNGLMCTELPKFQSNCEI